MFSREHVHPKNKGNPKCIYWPISAKSTSFPTEIIRFIYFFIVFFLFSAVRKKAQNGTNGKKDYFFGLIFCFQKTEPEKNYFFAWSKFSAFGVILTMQLEPPKTQGQLQEELERQAAALEEDIRQLRALLAADRKRAIKDSRRRHAPDIAQRWKAVRGAIEVRPLERAGPQHPNAPHGGPRRDVRSSRLLAGTV